MPEPCVMPRCARLVSDGSPFPFCHFHVRRLDSATTQQLRYATRGTQAWDESVRLALLVLGAPPAPITEYSAEECAAELDRELKYRGEVFARRVATGAMTLPESERRMGIMLQIRRKGFTPP